MKKITRNPDGIRDLERQANAMRNARLFVYDTPFNLCGSARTNADDTMQDERHDPNDLDFWAEKYFSTLEFLITCNEVSDKTRRWFERRGIVG